MKPSQALALGGVQREPGGCGPLRLAAWSLIPRDTLGVLETGMQKGIGSLCLYVMCFKLHLKVQRKKEIIAFN